MEYRKFLVPTAILTIFLAYEGCQQKDQQAAKTDYASSNRNDDETSRTKNIIISAYETGNLQLLNQATSDRDQLARAFDYLLGTKPEFQDLRKEYRDYNSLFALLANSSQMNYLVSRMRTSLDTWQRAQGMKPTWDQMRQDKERFGGYANDNRPLTPQERQDRQQVLNVRPDNQQTPDQRKQQEAAENERKRQDLLKKPQQATDALKKLFHK